jgi:hypothetical protein
MINEEETILEVKKKGSIDIGKKEITNNRPLSSKIEQHHKSRTPAISNRLTNNSNSSNNNVSNNKEVNQYHNMMPNNNGLNNNNRHRVGNNNNLINGKK